MGDIITAGKPPTKACGECPFCPPDILVEVWLAKDTYTYNLRLDTQEFAYSTTVNTVHLSSEDDLFGTSFFDWENEPYIGECSTGVWSGSATLAFNQNARFGILLSGKIGAKISLSIPYYTTPKDYTVIEGNTCTYSISLGDEYDAGYIQVELIIEEENVMSYSDDGTVIALYNIDNYDTDTATATVGTNQDFSLPTPEGNAINKIYKYSYGA